MITWGIPWIFVTHFYVVPMHSTASGCPPSASRWFPLLPDDSLCFPDILPLLPEIFPLLPDILPLLPDDSYCLLMPSCCFPKGFLDSLWLNAAQDVGRQTCHSPSRHPCPHHLHHAEGKKKNVFNTLCIRVKEQMEALSAEWQEYCGCGLPLPCSVDEKGDAPAIFPQTQGVLDEDIAFADARCLFSWVPSYLWKSNGDVTSSRRLSWVPREC